MSVFETDSRLPFTAGIIAIIASVGGAVAAVIGVFLTPMSIVTFLFMLITLVLLALAGWMGWQLVGYVRSSYALDRNAFVIRWGPVSEIVPMAEVQRVIAAADISDGLRFRRFPLPGWWRGSGRHPALGRLEFYSTEPLSNQIVVITPERNYVISPYDAEAFLDSFKARFDMRPTQPVAYSRAAPGFLSWHFWRDRAAHALLVAAIALNLGLFGLSMARYPSAPAQVPLHFDAAGIPDRVGPRTQLFTPAFVALALLIISIALGVTLYARKERLLAYLLWGGSAAVQAMFAVAAMTIGFSAL
jgi:Bacterial PH domain/Protein of unknown function (DUF1648)